MSCKYIVRVSHSIETLVEVWHMSRCTLGPRLGPDVEAPLHTHRLGQIRISTTLSALCVECRCQLVPVQVPPHPLLVNIMLLARPASPSRRLMTRRNPYETSSSRMDP